MAEPQLSVVIPAYNEEDAITRTLEAVAQYLRAGHVEYELIVVDDGSTDHTLPIIEALAARMPGLRVLPALHQGKGAAVKRGMLEARGQTILFMDADYSTQIDEWAKCAPWIERSYDVVIGSRKMSGAQVRRHQPPLREAMGRVFTWLTNRMLGTGVTDITCGFKCFKRAAAAQIFQLVRIDGWGFDAEILFIANRLGLRIKEVPVAWADDASTKVHLAKDAVRSLKELIQIRIGAWRGSYAIARVLPVKAHQERR